MASDLEDDDVLHSSSFLRPQMLASRKEGSPVMAVPVAPPVAQAAPRQEAGNGQQLQKEDKEEEEDDGDEDERPRELPRERMGGGNPFAGGSAPLARPVAQRMAPFAQRPPPQQLNPHHHHLHHPQFPAEQPTIAPPVDEYLRVSSKCSARHCFRVQWEAEMNPRCREKTALNVAGKIYLFDGFYILCHDETPDVPQFEYTRGGVMCRIQFVRESLPQGLLPPPTERGRLSTSYGCVKMMELKKYLFQMLLGIQTMHLFPQTVFGDPSCATGDVDDYCSDMHLIPRFVSVSDPPLLNIDDLMAPHRIGFAVGKFLPVEHVLGCLGATSNCRVDDFLKMNPPKVIVDAIVSTRIQGVPCVFRVDSLVYEESHDAPPPVDTNSTSANDTESSQEKKNPQLRRLRHLGQGAIEYDGVESKKKLRKWQEVGPLVQVSPRVDAHTELLDPEQCHLTGLRADVFEVASAMPMVLKYMRHYKLLASFEVDMHLAFRDKTLLRQAFTHGSYVDAAMQSVNTVEATISRVRLGHVFENTASLKRDRSAAFRAGESKMDPEMKRVTEQHLASDFKPEFHSKYLCPYERLEFLGDAVLSFLVATSSFLKLPHSDGESVLHDTRKEITNNAALGRVALAANFETLMLTAYDLQQLALDKTSKIAADCMEALLGAVYTDQGMDACRRLLLELMARYAPDVRGKYLLEMDEIVARAAAYTALDRDRFAQSAKVDEMREAHRQFTKKTNVVIRNPHLWLQAVTHGSFKAPQIDDDEFLCTDPSYERIEFLGDAVLQLLSSEFLVDALPHYQEHLLTQARSSLVKNTRLAQVAKDAGYHDFIRLGNLVKQNMTTTTNALYTEDVLADVFEATLGAVFLENPRDLEKVRSILTHTLFPLLTQAIRRREWMNPEKILSHYLTDWGRGANKRIDCAFRTLGSQQGNEHCVALYINRFRVAHGSGRTIQEAKNRACKQALYLYGIGLAT